MKNPPDIKVTLKGIHRAALKDLGDRTGLSWNQIINLVWANSADYRTRLAEMHNAKGSK